MTKNKVNNFINKEFETIIKDSREYRAYELGTAAGFFQLYKSILMDDGEEKAQEQFKSFIYGTKRTNEYFRKLIELDKEEKIQTIHT